MGKVLDEEPVVGQNAGAKRRASINFANDRLPADYCFANDKDMLTAR